MKCFECGNLAEYSHHVVPKSRGGERTVLLCSFCHSKAHHYKRNMSAARLTQEALDRKRRNGYRIGEIPYGFRLHKVIKKKLVKNIQEQKTIRLIIKLRESGVSARAIGDYLNNKKIPTHKGQKWCHQTILSILNRNM